MTFVEPIIALLIGLATGAVATAIQKSKPAQTLLKYGPVVKKAYDIIDPVLDQNLHNWKGSQVDKAFELAIEVASDGNLTPAEIKMIAYSMAQAWLPRKAADKVREFEAASNSVPELQEAANIAAKINGKVN
jgi:hypothetical protein